MSSKPEKMPRGLEVLHQDGQLRLLYRHHRGAGLLMLMAGLFWTVMLIPSFRFLAGGASFGPGELLAFLPFLTIALGFDYVGLAKLLGKTEVAFTPENVKVSHTPLPWFGACQVPLSSIVGFQVKRDLNPRDLRHRVTLGLVADLGDGRQVPLLRAISDAKAARKMHELATAYLQEARGSS